MLGVLSPKWRVRVKIEVLNIIRNVDKGSILQPALRTLLSLVYSGMSRESFLLVLTVLAINLNKTFFDSLIRLR